MFLIIPLNQFAMYCFYFFYQMKKLLHVLKVKKLSFEQRHLIYMYK